MSCIGTGIPRNQNSERAARNDGVTTGRGEQPFVSDSDAGGDESCRLRESSDHRSFGLRSGHIQSQR